MPAVGSFVINSMTDYALDFYVRSPMMLQNVQNKPLLSWLEANKMSFPGGKTNIQIPVQGSKMNDTSGFFAGFTNDSALTFTNMAVGTHAVFPWKEVHAGFGITFSELKRDDIVVVDGEQQMKEASEVDRTRISAVLKSALNDFSESWALAKNNMSWRDGTQDSNATPGIKSLIVDDPTTGTVGSIAQASNTWWRSRAQLSVGPSAQNQTLTKLLRNEILQLRRYGGNPNKILCGSGFWDGLMQEVDAKGLYTQTGFTGDNDIGLQKISISGIGTFEYDPTLDDLGEQKSCYVLDSKAIKLQPMENAHNQTFNPARPYQYMVLLRSLVDTCAITANRLNSSAKYTLA